VGPRPGPIAATVDRTHRRSLGTSWPEWSTALGYGTTGLSVGQRVFGPRGTGIATAPWPSMWRSRARNLAPLPGRRRLHGGREPADLGTDRMARAVPARPPSGGPERPRARRGRRSRFDGDATRTRGRRLRHRHRGAPPTVRRRSTSARRSSSTSTTTPWKTSAEVDLVFDVIGGDIGKRVRRPDSSRRNTGVHRRAGRSAARRRPGGRLRCRVRSCPN